MINILYPPYKDEILYSWYSRHDFCSGIFYSTNIKEWFNSKVGVTCRPDMFQQAASEKSCSISEQPIKRCREDFQA